LAQHSPSLHPTHVATPLPLTLPVPNFLPILTLRASASSAFLAHTARCLHLLPGSLVIPIQTPPVYSLLSTSPRWAHPHYCSIRHFCFHVYRGAGKRQLGLPLSLSASSPHEQAASKRISWMFYKCAGKLALSLFFLFTPPPSPPQVPKSTLFFFRSLAFPHWVLQSTRFFFSLGP
jgi:hypothetical protein